MPTYAQLQAETYWVAEFQPPSIASLCQRLRVFFKVGSNAIGSKGDNNHLRGYHRSYAWVRNSAWSSNRTYSVTETAGNRNPGDVNWLCAVDMTVPADQLIPMCHRLDIAVRAGKLEKITEWYGNDDGDNRVDGYNNVANVVASSDDSHLWHLHLSFDRGRANENHDDLYAVLTGQSREGETAMRYMFAADIPGADTTHVYVTDGIRYRVPPDSAQVDAVMLRAGAGQITLVKKADMPATWTFERIVQSLCGTPDFGELGSAEPVPPSPGGGLSEAQVRAIVREELDRTKLGAE